MKSMVLKPELVCDLLEDVNFSLKLIWIVQKLLY